MTNRRKQLEASVSQLESQLKKETDLKSQSQQSLLEMEKKLASEKQRVTEWKGKYEKAKIQRVEIVCYLKI